MLTRLRDGDAIEADVTLTEHGVEEIICTPMMSVKSTSFPEAEINLYLTQSFISRSM